MPLESSNVQATVLCTNVGLNQAEPFNSISVFPNPSNSEFTFQLDKLTSDAELIVRDVTGRIVESRKLAADESTFSFGSQLPNCFYMAELWANGSRHVVKLHKL